MLRVATARFGVQCVIEAIVGNDIDIDISEKSYSTNTIYSYGKVTQGWLSMEMAISKCYGLSRNHYFRFVL